MEGGETATTHGNATRLVIKATYYPKGISSGDWFMYGTNVYDPDRVYANFAALKAAYDADVVDAAANPTLTYPLIAAYEKFAGQIKAYYDSEAPVASDAPAAPATIADVTAEHLDGIENVGGEVAKVGIDGVGIHWYQNGLNYYASVVRHDNTVTVDNGYTKYGVVRNNWYLLTLTRVSGPGTPWYPDPNKPGEGDPDPTTPVDKSKGYLGITVTPAPWVKWDTNIGI
jgi:hypothetical protein